MSGAGVTCRVAAAAITLPFLLALPAEHDPARAVWNTALWLLVAAVFLCGSFVAQRLATLIHGPGLIAAFAALFSTLGLLGFMSVEHYRFSQVVTDLGLLYLTFFVAAAVGRFAPPLGRAALALGVLALSLAAIVQAVHFHAFGFAIGADGYRAILQSNAGEALEFLGRHLRAGAIAVALVSVLVAAGAAFGTLLPRLTTEALASGGVFALAAIAVLGGQRDLVALRMAGFAESVDYAIEIAQYRAVRAARGASSGSLALKQHSPLADQPQTHVFVIAESLSRNHMSIYGYWRDTTPALEGLGRELVAFTDVVSPHSHTDQSLERVLTLANHANRLSFTDRANYSLIELLRAAGFETWWLSNQNSFGPWDNKTSVLAGGAHHVHFTGARSGAMVSGPYDEALLEPFAAALRAPSPRKAIFLHVLGNHWEYAKRFPPHAAVFRAPLTAAEIGALRRTHPRLDMVNDYDNAVHYHDQLVGRIVDQLRTLRHPTVLTLLADHGESVYRFKGHYWREFTHDHVEVPLAFWFSPEYAKLAADTVARARLVANLPFALEDLPHLVADVTGLRGPLLNPERSPLSTPYRVPPARHLFEGQLVYEHADEAPLNARRVLRRLAERHPQFAASLWAHRVNTLGKMMSVARLFAGAEIDVVYDGKTRALLVNHPPEPPSGLSLEALLRYAHRLNPQLALWLDVKNLNEINAEHVLAELDRLDKLYAIRARSLVETDHTGPAAGALRQAGFLTSYYLRPAVAVEDSANATTVSCYGAADIAQVVSARRFAAVSYDWRGRQWVDRCLERLVRERGLRRYVWDLEPVTSDAGALAILSDERVRQYVGIAAVLLPYRSQFDDVQ